MKILVVKGGFSKEREISLRTGATFEASVIKLGHELLSFDLQENNVSEMIGLIQKAKPDLVLNALHGTFGEDGTVQNIFDTLQVPYSHSNALSSSMAMSKVQSKIVFDHFGLPTPAWSEVALFDFDAGLRPIPMPFVLKAVAEGSSFGVYLIKTEEDLQHVLKNEWTYGNTALVEAYIEGREFTVSILDDDVLGVAEIKTDHTFFDYESKYTKGVAERLIPAPISPEETTKICNLAKAAHKALECKGLTRSDFMYDGETYYLLELNTQPGFTETSFATLKAKQRGWTIEYLVSKIIESALETSSQSKAQNKVAL